MPGAFVRPRSFDMLSGSYAHAMTISRKLSSLVAVVLLAGLSLSACGDKDDKEGADSKPESSSSASDAKLTKDNFATVIGAAMTKAGSAHVEMKGGVGGQSLEGSGDQKVGDKPADSAIALKMDVAGSEMEIRLVDKVIYLGMGQMSGNKFFKVDLKDKSNPLVSQFGQFTDQADLATQFKVFQEALTGFEQKGESKEIDGVTTTPYDITVDSAKMTKATGKDASNLPKELTYTFFIGTDNLVRRMVVEVSGVGMTADYSKWGEPVDIKAPPASEISDKDLSELGGVPAPS
jgi:hypothetical protein